MEIYDIFKNYAGQECTLKSDDIRLSEKMLNLSNVKHDDTIWIPLKLKLDDLSRDNAFDFAAHANELAIEQTDEDICWCDDCDYDKSYISLGFDPMALANGMGYCNFPNAPISAQITILPFYRTPAEIRAEIANAKKSDEVTNKQAVREDGCEPIYFSDEVKERVEDEQQWLKTHDSMDGHNSYWSVKITPAEFKEIKKMLLNIPEIKKIAEIN